MDCFTGFSVEIHIRIHFHLSFFLSVGKWASPAAFPSLAETSSTPLVYNVIFLSNFLLDCTKNAYKSTWIHQRYLHNCQLTKANADNEAVWAAIAQL